MRSATSKNLAEMFLLWVFLQFSSAPASHAEDLAKITPTGYVTDLAGTLTPGTVSYTHLDVYKRQRDTYMATGARYSMRRMESRSAITDIADPTELSFPGRSRLWIRACSSSTHCSR